MTYSEFERNSSINLRKFKLNKKIPNNWIRLVGAGSGGYFLVSVKTEISNPDELLISNEFISQFNSGLKNKSWYCSN